MNLRQRMVLDSHLQKVHNETSKTGDRIVFMACGVIATLLFAGVIA